MNVKFATFFKSKNSWTSMHVFVLMRQRWKLTISQRTRKVLSSLLLISRCVIHDAQPPASRMGIYYLNDLFVAVRKPTGSGRMLQLQSTESVQWQVSLLSCENNLSHLFDVDLSTGVSDNRLSAGVLHLERPPIQEVCLPMPNVHLGAHEYASHHPRQPLWAC